MNTSPSYQSTTHCIVGGRVKRCSTKWIEDEKKNDNKHQSNEEVYHNFTIGRFVKQVNVMVITHNIICDFVYEV